MRRFRNFVVMHLLYYRIDDIYWKPGDTIADKVDAHLMNSGHAKGSLNAWRKLLPLLTELHGNTSENFEWSMDYYRHFIKVLKDTSPNSALERKLEKLLNKYREKLPTANVPVAWQITVSQNSKVVKINRFQDS